MTAECDIYLTPGDWVDLGLPSGLMWATRNVGASLPTDYGNYYAWGETTPKKVYEWSTYRWYNKDGGQIDYDEMTKYTGSDNLTTLQPDDDAAIVNYGGRTPTKEEWLELYNNTTCRWITINGVNGRCFTGTNGNRIFLPAAGDRWGSSLCGDGTYGHYWSSLLDTDFPYCAWYFYFDSVDIGWYSYGGILSRNYGFSVRAVR